MTNREKVDQITQQLVNGCTGILVQGGPGTGKTALAVSVARQLVDAGKRVAVTAVREQAVGVIEQRLPAALRHWSLVLSEQEVDPHMTLRNDVQRMLDSCAQTETHQELIDTHSALTRDVALAAETLQTAQDNMGRLTEGVGENVLRKALAEGLRSNRWLLRLGVKPDGETAPVSSENMLAALEQMREKRQADAQTPLEPRFLPGKEEVNGYFECITQQPPVVHTSHQALTASIEGASSWQIASLAAVIRALGRFGREHPYLSDTKHLTGSLQIDRRQIRATSRLLNKMTDEIVDVCALKVDGVPCWLASRLQDMAARLETYFSTGGTRLGAAGVPALWPALKLLRCRINGELVSSAQQLRQLRGWLVLCELREHAAEKGCETLFDLCLEYRESLGTTVKALSLMPSLLAGHSMTLKQWLDVFGRIRQRLDLEKKKGDLRCHIVTAGEKHPVVGQLQAALDRGDELAYWRAMQSLEREQVLRNMSWVSVVSSHIPCKAVADAVVKIAGRCESAIWQQRFDQIEQAWQACADYLSYRDLAVRIAQVEKARHALMQELDTLEQSHARQIFDARMAARVSDRQRRAMIGWKQTLDRIGRGTGPHADMYRQQAIAMHGDVFEGVALTLGTVQQLIQLCSFNKPLFDVLIVDEATQIGLEGVLLFQLANQVVVIGDDEQTSHATIGQLPGYTDLLRQQLLPDNNHAPALNPSANLFELAELAFHQRYRLRDHYRCPAAIVDFVNQIAYQDEPLRAVTTFRSDNLPPVVTEFVPQIPMDVMSVKQKVNAAEAEAIITCLELLMQQRAHANTSFAVISLYGKAHADYLEKAVAARFTARQRDEHRLIVGTAADLQGDERDVVLVSLGIAPGQRTRALTTRGDRQRFNVALTRARRQIRLFHSVESTDLPSTCLRRQLLEWAQENQGQGRDLAVNFDGLTVSESGAKTFDWDAYEIDSEYLPKLAVGEC